MKRRPSDTNSVPVYSTDTGRVRPASPGGGGEGRAAPRKGDGGGRPVARLRIERAGRGGKTVTVAAGIQGSAEMLRDLLKDLKAACGSGGTLREGRDGSELELQGDHVTKVAALLEERGYLVKGAGTRP